MTEPDWTLIRTFLEVAETGAFSRAARSLDLSQPTVGRHVKELEKQLGVDLFSRETRGQSLTADGALLVERAREMKAAAARLELAARGREDTLEGTVRITASMVVSHFVLPAILADIRIAYPGITIELVPSDAPENLLFREADIAVRMFRPTQLDIVTAHICDQPIGLYAAHSYLQRVGVPETLDAFLECDLVGFDRSDLIIRAMRQAGINATRETFALRCDDQAAFWQLVVAGCGIGGMQQRIGNAEPRVARVLPEFPLPPLPVWLAAPEAIRHTPRIRVVWDLLAAGLKAPLP